MDMDIEEKIAQGYYESKLPYPDMDCSKEEKTAMRGLVRADNNRLAAEFKRDVLKCHGLTNHPKADKIYDFAVDLGGSYRQINDILLDLSDIIL
jgi:hypothetical protein